MSTTYFPSSKYYNAPLSNISVSQSQSHFQPRLSSDRDRRSKEIQDRLNELSKSVSIRSNVNVRQQYQQKQALLSRLEQIKAEREAMNQYIENKENRNQEQHISRSMSFESLRNEKKKYHEIVSKLSNSWENDFQVTKHTIQTITIIVLCN